MFNGLKMYPNFRSCGDSHSKAIYVVHPKNGGAPLSLKSPHVFRTTCIFSLTPLLWFLFPVYMLGKSFQQAGPNALDFYTSNERTKYLASEFKEIHR